MSGGQSEFGNQGKNSQDFELNLASIIDCFTVLITFMLASASFLSIGILDAGVTAAGATQSSEKPPSVTVTVDLGKDHLLNIKIAGKSSSTTPLRAQASDWDYESLSKNLGSIKQRWGDVNAVTLTADNSVEYKDVVKTMEVVRKVIPVVLIGGF